MIKLIAYHVESPEDGTVKITDSTGDGIISNDCEELLNFFYKPYRTAKDRELKFFWDIDESMSHIFKLMPPDQCKALLNTSFKDTTRLYYRRGLNFIIKGDIQINNHQYWCCLYSLSNLVKQEVAPKSAKELLELGKKLLLACNNIGISTPLTLNSAIGMYESSMRNIELTPDIKCIPAESVDVLNYAKHCANRQGWISAYKVGHFDNVADYDISGCYAYWLSQIRDFKAAEYSRYQKDHPYKSLVGTGDVTGYFKVKLTIFDHIKVHPFACVDETGLPIYPIGKFETYLTLEEIIAIYKYKVGKVEIIDGWYIRFTNRGKPMLNIVNRLFKMRELGEIENDLCKGILVGYVGKMNAQFEDDRTSKTYNPLIPAWIYAQARLQVFKFIMDNDLKHNLIAVSTDGVMSTKQATKTYIASKRELGAWRLNKPVPALVLSPGWIIYKDKKPHSVDYDTAMSLIKDNPNESHFKITLKQRVTLFEAVEMLHDLSKVGLITDHFNSIDLPEIQMAQDRIFSKFPTTGKQLLQGTIYESEPIEV